MVAEMILMLLQTQKEKVSKCHCRVLIFSVCLHNDKLQETILH